MTTAQQVGMTVRELRTAESTENASRLLQRVWRGAAAPVPPNILRTVQHTGGYAFGVYDERDEMVAASLGLLTSAGLHSHITGVDVGGQRRGLGYALKQHQREWALERGIDVITWTCDPLVRRNVVFNLHALGATVADYLPNFYGAMLDELNRGEATDRFELHWDLRSPAATQAQQGRLPLLPEAGTLVPLPDDIEALRATDLAAASRWRHSVRDAVLASLAAGERVLGVTASGSLVLGA